MAAARKYAKGLAAAAGLAAAVSTQAALPTQYALWGSVASAVLGVAAVIGVPNRNTTVGDLEDDVRQIVTAVKDATAHIPPPPAPPAPLSDAVTAALAILTPPQG